MKSSLGGEEFMIFGHCIIPAMQFSVCPLEALGDEDITGIRKSLS